MLDVYERWVRRVVRRPGLTVAVLMASFVASLGIYPFLGVSFFPRTDAGQFTINLKAPTGTRIELTNDYVAKVEKLIKNTVLPADFRMTVSNIGVVNDFRRSTPPTPVPIPRRFRRSSPTITKSAATSTWTKCSGASNGNTPNCGRSSKADRWWMPS